MGSLLSAEINDRSIKTHYIIDLIDGYMRSRHASRKNIEIIINWLGFRGRRLMAVFSVVKTSGRLSIAVNEYDDRSQWKTFNQI